MQEQSTPDRPFGEDRLVEASLPDRSARLLLVDASATAFETEYRHLSGRLASCVMARAAAGVLLLAADLKGDERVALQIRAEGPLEGLLAEADAALRFRGYTNKKVVSELDRGEAPIEAGLTATGRLQVIRSTGAAVVYRGVTSLRRGDLEADIEAALVESAQIPSRLFLDHGYDRQLAFASGVLLQALPGGDEGAFAAFAAAVAARAEAARPFGRDLSALLDRLLPNSEPRKVLSTRPVAFKCRCSREKVVAMLRGLGPPEEGAFPPLSRVVCAFCNDSFEIPASELS
jgi:molecular chaperone Hsp33